MAERELEQRILELSRFAGELVADTKRVYLESGARASASRRPWRGSSWNAR